MRKGKEKENIQRASKEEHKQSSIISGIALDILLDPHASLRNRQGEGVGVRRPNKDSGPRRRLGSKVFIGELGEGVDGEEREEGAYAREE